MSVTRLGRWAALVVTLLIGTPVIAQEAAGDPIKLSDEFRSLTAGIALRPPASFEKLETEPGANQIARWVDRERQWGLTLTRLQLDSPGVLTSTRDENGDMQQGVANRVLETFTADAPPRVLRNDSVRLGNAAAVVMAIHFARQEQTQLSQRAVIRSNDRVYYFLDLTTPAPNENVAEDPEIRQAIALFTQVLDTVEIIDQSEIKEDQVQRLFRTRALMINWTPQRLGERLIEKQWARILKDGKDVGYVFTVEEAAADLPRRGQINAAPPGQVPGLLVGTRSRVMQGDNQVDVSKWAWMAADRQRETWSTTTWYTPLNKPEVLEGQTALKLDTAYATEIGNSVQKLRAIAVDGFQPAEGAGGNKGMVADKEWRLEVQTVTDIDRPEPLVRSLPPFYLPQPLAHLLPRLLPLSRATGYMFAQWNPEVGEVMTRYIDVGSPASVLIGGQSVVAVPIEDHMGLEGDVTTHYYSQEGRYLGSINRENGVTLLPTTPEMIRSIWGDAIELDRPDVVGD